MCVFGLKKDTPQQLTFFHDIRPLSHSLHTHTHTHTQPYHISRVVVFEVTTERKERLGEGDWCHCWSCPSVVPPRFYCSGAGTGLPADMSELMFHQGHVVWRWTPLRRSTTKIQNTQNMPPVSNSHSHIFLSPFSLSLFLSHSSHRAAGVLSLAISSRNILWQVMTIGQT
jgi:hypothetical protein